MKCELYLDPQHLFKCIEFMVVTVDTVRKSQYVKRKGEANCKTRCNISEMFKGFGCKRDARANKAVQHVILTIYCNTICAA